MKIYLIFFLKGHYFLDIQYVCKSICPFLSEPKVVFVSLFVCSFHPSVRQFSFVSKKLSFTGKYN